MKSIIRWGALWQSENQLDGKQEYIICADCVPVLFLTRRESRAYIETRYGYIKNRKDLRQEPHGWRLPKPIRLKIGATR